MPATKLPALPQLTLASPQLWYDWLSKHHASSSGVWLVLRKKGSACVSTLTYANALDQALMWGWIDSQKQRLDDTAYIQRFGPRRPRSTWSKVNVGKATALIAAGKMQLPGLAEVERAKEDGRWAAAYDSQRMAQPSPELLAALSKRPAAEAAFASLKAADRYAMILGVQTAKMAATRERRIHKYVEQLAGGEVL